MRAKPESPIIDGERYLSVNETAEVSGLSPLTVRNLARTGWLDAIKKGGCWWIPPFRAQERARIVQRRKTENTQWTINSGWREKAPDLVPVGMKARGAPPARIDFRTLPILPNETWIAAERARSYLNLSRSSFKYQAKTRITIPESALIMGCSPLTVRNHVRSGRLIVWQEHPGRQGSRIYLCSLQIHRIAREPERIAAKKAESGIKMADPEKQERSREFRSKHRIDPDTQIGNRAVIDRELGDSYTSRQVATLLGITISSVRALVKSRRLQAYQRPLKPGQLSKRKWLYFKKEDVHALMEDPIYQAHKRRQETKKRNEEERKYREQNPPDPTEEQARAYDKHKRILRAQQNDPDLTNHSTRGGW